MKTFTLRLASAALKVLAHRTSGIVTVLESPIWRKAERPKFNARTARVMTALCGLVDSIASLTNDDRRFLTVWFRLFPIAQEVLDCEWLVKNNIHLVWGPGRHIIGHNIAIYHRNADKVRFEFFCEMDLMKDEALGYFDPRGPGTRTAAAEGVGAGYAAQLLGVWLGTDHPRGYQTVE